MSLVVRENYWTWTSGRGTEGGHEGLSESASYWESRYRSGGSSSSAMEYDERVLRWRGDFVKWLAASYGLESIADLGAGDGQQLAFFPLTARYVGVEVSPTAVQELQQTFGAPGRAFVLYYVFSNSELERILF